MIRLLVLVAVSQAVLLDRVVVLVDGEAILRSELNERARPYLERVKTEEARVTVLADVRDELINELLVEHDARALHLKLSSEDIDRALAAVAEANTLTVEQLEKYVREQGLTMRTYRRVIERQLLRQYWLNHKLDGGLGKLTPEQIVVEEQKQLSVLRERGVIEVLQ